MVSFTFLRLYAHQIKVSRNVYIFYLFLFNSIAPKIIFGYKLYYPFSLAPPPQSYAYVLKLELICIYLFMIYFMTLSVPQVIWRRISGQLIY
jgi:hypothetical protein